MSGAEILERLQTLGAAVSVDGDNLRLRYPREKLSADLLHAVKKGKAELIGLLTASPGAEVSIGDSAVRRCQCQGCTACEGDGASITGARPWRADGLRQPGAPGASASCRQSHPSLKERGMIDRLLQVRCPYCNRLAAEASEGSVLRVKCSRCGALFERQLPRQRSLGDRRGGGL